MSSVRVLVGTRKGAFILTSDGTRKNWDVNGPHFGGWEMYHLNVLIINSELGERDVEAILCQLP